MKNMGQSAKQTNKKAQALSCSSKSFDFTCNLLAHAKQVQRVGITEAAIHRWNKAFKNGPSKICGRQPLKNFTWSILEYFVPDVQKDNQPKLTQRPQPI